MLALRRYGIPFLLMHYPAIEKRFFGPLFQSSYDFLKFAVVWVGGVELVYVLIEDGCSEAHECGSAFRFGSFLSQLKVNVCCNEAERECHEHCGVSQDDSTRGRPLLL